MEKKFTYICGRCKKQEKVKLSFVERQLRECADNEDCIFPGLYCDDCIEVIDEFGDGFLFD